MNQIFRAVVAAAVVCAVPAFAQADDKITKKDGSTVAGQIMEWDYRNAKVQLPGAGKATTNVKTDDIESVEYGGLTKEWKDADTDYKSGKDDAAVGKFKALAENKKLRAALRQEAFWNAANASFRLGKDEDGVAMLKTLISEAEFPSSRYLGAAQDNIVRGLTRMGKSADSIAFADAEISRTGRLADSAAFVDRLKLMRCRALLAQGKAKDAKVDAGSLAQGTGAMSGEAKVLMASIAFAEKDNAAAETQATAALKLSLSNAARAECYNVIGKCLLEKGKATNKSDLIRDALLKFLRSALQFPPAPGEDTGAHEEALFNAAESFFFIAELGKGDDQVRSFSRARDLYRRVLAEYPQSRFKDPASKRLERLK